MCRCSLANVFFLRSYLVRANLYSLYSSYSSSLSASDRPSMLVAVGLISFGSGTLGSCRAGTCAFDGSTYSQTWSVAAVDFTTSSHSTQSSVPFRLTETFVVVVEDMPKSCEVL